MTTLQLHQSATLQAKVDERTITGMVLPYGSPGRTSLGMITAAKGVVELGPDVTLNLEHDDTRPVGRLVSSTETDHGLLATFRVARTRAGDDLLAEVAEGLRTGLSVEVESPVIKAGQLLSGLLTAVGAVVRPAFDLARVSAMTAADTDTPPDPPADQPADPEADGQGPTDLIDQASALLDQAKEALTEPADEADSPTQGETDVTPEAQASAAAPATLSASVAARPSGQLTAADIPDVQTFIRTVAANRHDKALMATLTDVESTGITGDIAAPQWVGKLWEGQPYQRQIVPLMDNRPLTSWTLKGWRFGTKPEVHTYAGDKAPITSSAVTTDPVESTVLRLAGGNDLDRKFTDFGDTEFLSAYMGALAESYAIKTDDAALAFLQASATDVTALGAASGMSSGVAAVVDGALACLQARVNPTYAIVSPGLWRSLLLTPQDDLIALLSQSFSLGDGTLAGFRIIPVVGLEAAQVIVGAKQAAQFSELPGVPIRVSALDVANGGVDEALFGYYATMLHYATGISAVSVPMVTLNAGPDFSLDVADDDLALDVLGVIGDGSSIHLGDEAVLTSATPAAATIVANKVHAVADGTSVITATYTQPSGATVTDTVTVTVTSV